MSKGLVPTQDSGAFGNHRGCAPGQRCFCSALVHCSSPAMFGYETGEDASSRKQSNALQKQPRFIAARCVSHTRKSIPCLHCGICCPQVQVGNTAKPCLVYDKVWPSNIPLTRVALSALAGSPLPLSVPRAPSVGDRPQELQPAGTELPIPVGRDVLCTLPRCLPTELEKLLNNTSAA